MSAESPDVKIARMEERLTVMLSELQQAKDGRKQQYETLEAINRALLKIENRVQGVEEQLSRATPTIDEFITIKHKVVGAGALGKWVWAAGSCIITILATSRETIFTWLAK